MNEMLLQNDHDAYTLLKIQACGYFFQFFNLFLAIISVYLAVHLNPATSTPVSKIIMT